MIDCSLMRLGLLGREHETLKPIGLMPFYAVEKNIVTGGENDGIPDPIHKAIGVSE